MIIGSRPSTIVPQGMTLAGVSLGELEVNTEGLALAINKMAELAVGAESGPSVAEHFLALTYVRVGPAEAKDAVWVQQREWSRHICCTRCANRW